MTKLISRPARHRRHLPPPGEHLSSHQASADARPAVDTPDGDTVAPSTDDEPKGIQETAEKEKGFLRYRSAWRAHALARIDYLRAQVDLESARDSSEADLRASLIAGARELLAAAEQATFNLWPRGWLSGWATERTWASIHSAEILLLQLSEGDALASRGLHICSMLQYVKTDNGHRNEVKKICESIMAGAELSAREHQVLISSLTEAYRNRDNEFARIRSVRNILVISTCLTLLLVVAFTVLLYTNAVPPLNLCFRSQSNPAPALPDICASGHAFSASSAANDVLMIEIAGVFGAAMTAIASLHYMRGTSVPYMIQLSSASLKIPTGALSAVVGIMLIHGQFVPGLTDLDSPGQILAWAVAFGAAQHLVTRMVDARARDVLPASERGEDPPKDGAR